VVVFLSRGLVQRFLYEEDRTGWLAVARLAMGYPVTIGALALTVLVVRRVRRDRPEHIELSHGEVHVTEQDVVATEPERAAER
jgi:Protein of unknown function (DUF3159)